MKTNFGKIERNLTGIVTVARGVLCNRLAVPAILAAVAAMLWAVPAFALQQAEPAKAQPAAEPSKTDPAKAEPNKPVPSIDKSTKAKKSESGEQLRMPGEVKALQLPKDGTKPAEGEAVKPDGPSPSLKIDEPNKDFGTVWIGPALTHEFTITNVGAGPLEIKSVRPACGCTVAGEWPKSIAPGESGKFPFSIATTKLHNKFEKPITITSNDPVNPDFKLKLIGEVKRYIDITPPNAAFGKIVAEDPQERKLTITNNSATPLQITMTQPPADSKFKFELVELAPGKNYEVNVTTLPPLESGQLKGQVTLTTNIEAQKSIDIMATATVPERLDVNPTTLIISPVTPPVAGAPPDSGTASRAVMFTNYGKTPVKVLEAKSDDPEKLKLTVSEKEAGKSYQIQVEWPKDYAPEVGKKITLVTDDAAKPTIDVPVQSSRAAQKDKAQPKGAELLVGKPAPSFSLTTTDGKPVSNADLNNNITVLNFFAPNCGFCKKQMPRLEPIKADYAAKGVRFLTVSETMRKEFTTPEVMDVLKGLNVTGEVAIDAGNTAGNAFSATSFPTMLLVGKSGNVEAVNSGNLGDLETRLKAQLDALIAGKPLPKFETVTQAPARRPAEDMVGKPAPQFTLSTLDGKTVSDTDFTNHPATILNFVAPNCGFCKKQLPIVESVRQEYEAKGVRFVNMSQTMRKEFTNEEASKVFTDVGSKLEFAPDAGNKVGQTFQAGSYPTMMIVGKDGKIAHVNVGAGADLDAKLKAQLDSLITGKPYVAPAPVVAAAPPVNVTPIKIDGLNPTITVRDGAIVTDPPAVPLGDPAAAPKTETPKKSNNE